MKGKQKMATDVRDEYQGEIRIDWTLFCETIRRAETIAISGHIRPDGDAIGCLLAAKRALTALGKRVLLFNGHPVPPSLKYLDPAGEVRVASELDGQERAFIENADALMSVDASSWAQIGADVAPFYRNARGAVVVVDHHAVADEIGTVRCVEPRADSAGSVLFEGIKALGVELTREIARPLFAAISADTGWFRFGATKARTFERAAALVDAGAKVDEEYRLANEQESYGRFKLLGAAISSAKRFLDGKGVFMSLSRADFERATAISADSEDLVNVPLSVAGMEMAIIAIEQPDGTVKASFRSRCDVDCARLAKEFGGGGHKRASGATLACDLTAASDALIAKTIEYYAASRDDKAAL